MGFGDKIRGAIEDATGMGAISKALSPNGSSGIDRAMAAHADKEHPVASPPMFPPKPKFNPNPPGK
jgi:hypothetical protein